MKDENDKHRTKGKTESTHKLEFFTNLYQHELG